MNKIFLASLASILTACSSAQKTESSNEAYGTRSELPKPPYQAKRSGTVDLKGLQRSLELERSKMELGYEEKQFNTCEAGFGYPTENCSMKTLVSINFRLQCRDSVGTTSEIVTSDKLDAIDNEQVRWQMGAHQGVASTDYDGYGTILAVTQNSPRGARLRLAVGPQFVYVRAGELTRIVTPSTWCGPKD